MSVLKRLSTLIRSNLNDVVDAMQDPGKEIDQLVRDMEESSRDARKEVAMVLGEEKRMAKVIETMRQEAQSWEDKAAVAVRSGEDDLAREALARKAQKELEIAEMQKALQAQEVMVDQLTAGMKALEARVKEVKMRQGTLREKARAQKRGGGGLSAQTGAFADFDRMSSKIDAMEAESGLDEELSGRTREELDAARKLEALSEDKSMDDALAALKAKLGEKS